MLRRFPQSLKSLQHIVAKTSPAQPNTRTLTQLSFATPEADFCAHNATHHHREWSQTLSFASPEADFVSHNLVVDGQDHRHSSEWSQDISFASPEADFVVGAVEADATNSARASEWSQTMSFATPSSDFISPFQEDKQSAVSHDRHAPLPKSVDQAMNDVRAVVLKQPVAPFEVIDVNDAWVDLCGYSREEARGKSIGSLLQGPNTDLDAATSLVERLGREEYSETVLTNYRNNGEEFQNMIRLAMLQDNNGLPEYFVGVLHQLEAGERTSLSQS